MDWVILALVVGVVGYAIVIYNGLVRNRQMVSWADTLVKTLSGLICRSRLLSVPESSSLLNLC